MNSPFDHDHDSSQDTPPAGSGGSGWLWLIAGVIGFVILIVWLADENPGALDSEGSSMGLAYYSILLLVVASGVVGGWRYRTSTMFKHAAIWIAIGVVIVVGYSFRFELEGVKDRVVGEVAPQQGVADGSGAVTFRRSSGRHFRVAAVVDGVKLRFMVDTGASDVTLTPDDARRLGFDLRRLSFNRIYSTANGKVTGAPVRLGEVRVGPISMRNVRASVNGAPMGQSLLGMSFLDRLSSYEVRRDTLTMRR